MTYWKKVKHEKKPFKIEPQAKRKTTVKEQKNTDLNSSDNDDTIEKASSTDSGSNLNTKNQSETEAASDSLNVRNDTSENEAKELERESTKGQVTLLTMVAREEVQLLQNLQSTLEKKQQKKIPKPERKPQESSSKTKSTEQKINGDLKAIKMATKSSSRLKSVPEKLKNYFTEQDVEYFSSQENSDVFVSGKLRKK